MITKAHTLGSTNLHKAYEFAKLQAVNNIDKAVELVFPLARA